MTTDAQNRLLTVNEVAAQLRANPETVRRWLRQGKLKGILLGGDKMGWRIPESAVAALLNGSAS